MPLGLSNGNINWIEKAGFTASNFSDLVHTSNFMGLLTLFWTATSAQLSPWMWGLNAFFIWCFGYVVEKKMKPARYLALLLTLIPSGWILVFIFSQGYNYNKLYIGPSMLLFGLLGAYFAYFPKKPFKPQEWVRPNTQIFRHEEPTPHHERHWVSPWTYVIAFAAFEIFLQLGLTFDKDFFVAKTHIELLGTIHTAVFGRMQTNPAAFQPVAAIMNIGVGFFIGYMLPKLRASVKPVRPGGKLQLEVIQHYRELRTLDMTHEQACEGAAKFAAVPIDIAKDWISKGAAGLKDQDIR